MEEFGFGKGKRFTGIVCQPLTRGVAPALYMVGLPRFVANTVMIRCVVVYSFPVSAAKKHFTVCITAVSYEIRNYLSRVRRHRAIHSQHLFVRFCTNDHTSSNSSTSSACASSNVSSTSGSSWAFFYPLSQLLSRIRVNHSTTSARPTDNQLISYSSTHSVHQLHYPFISF